MCDTNIKVYQGILNTSERLAYSSAIDQQAQQGIKKKMRSVKRQFQEDDDQDTAATNPESSHRSQCTFLLVKQSEMLLLVRIRNSLL